MHFLDNNGNGKIIKNIYSFYMCMCKISIFSYRNVVQEMQLYCLKLRRNIFDVIIQTKHCKWVRALFGFANETSQEDFNGSL